MTNKLRVSKFTPPVEKDKMTKVRHRDISQTTDGVRQTAILPQVQGMGNKSSRKRRSGISLLVFFIGVCFILIDQHFSGLSLSPPPTTTTLNGGGSGDQEKWNSNAQEDLKLEDFVVSEFLGEGVINVVFLATLPDSLAQREGMWDHRHNKTRELVLKYIDASYEGHREITAFEGINGIDKAKAQEVGLMQAVWLGRDIPNPYHCERDRETCIRQVAASLPKNLTTKPLRLRRMHKMKFMDVVVVPYYKPLEILDHGKTLQDLKVFFRSMLEQLAVAHEAGINNLDLHAGNMYVDEDTGRAVLFDWNGYLPVGSPAYEKSQNWGISAPETWLERPYGIEAKSSSIHAIDTWQAGIAWNNLIHSPCRWSSPKVLKEGGESEKEKYLKDLIDALGGNTIITVDDKATVDLRTLAGLPKEETTAARRPHQIRIMLDHDRSSTCRKRSWMDDQKLSPKEKDQALDLLKQMLVLAPSDRPTMKELLQHPFLQL